MKKEGFVRISILILLAISMCGCGGVRRNDLLQSAAPGNCDLGWFTYDGTTGNFYVMSDTAMEEAFLAELSKVRIKEASFSVQVLLDGVWYMIPEIPGEWGFPEIAIILPAGITTKESVNLERYGELPVGTYRLVKKGMVAEFRIG